MQNYYEILNISKDSTDDEIKKAYLTMIKKYHPDIYQGDKVFAEQQTSLITEAYTTLKNKELRMKYDRKTFTNQPSRENENQAKNKAENIKPQKPKKQQEKKQTNKANKNSEKKEKNTENLTPEQKQAKNQKLILDLAIVALLLLLFLLIFFPLK